jgi:hypothetical protein
MGHVPPTPQFPGKRFGLYEPGEEIALADDVCFSRNQGFTFLRYEKGGKMTLIAALLP